MRRLLLPLLLTLTTALTARADDPVVATLGGTPITLSEVDAAGDAQLAVLKDSLHWARVAAAERLVGRRVIEIEAEAQGLSVSSYLEREVDSKITEPTDADVDAFWAQNPGAPPEQRAAMSEQVKAYMRDQRRAPIRAALIEQLKAKHAKGLELDLPTVRAELDIEGRPAKGPATAPVTIAAFTDYECAGCASAVQMLEALQGHFKDYLRIVHVDFPSKHHERAFPAAVAARCAGRFGKYWEYHDRLFEDVKDMSDERFLSIARDLGLDEQGFRDCCASPDVGAEVDADKALGEANGVEGTPHLFVNGLPLRGGLDDQSLGRLIAMELDRIGVPPPQR